MKKTYSISLEEDLMNKFIKLSEKLWTNKTNFLSMIITDVVKLEKITFYWYNNKEKFETKNEDFEIVTDKHIVDTINSVNWTNSNSLIFW
jgi:hypothetical protein